MLKHRFRETKEIKKLLIEMEALKIVFNTSKPLPHIEENLRRESLLKSALFSARIEGNPLDFEGAKLVSESKREKDIAKLEVFNLLRAHRHVYGHQVPKRLTIKFIQKLHQMTMKNLSADAGRWRKEQWGIFNQAGVAVYLAPAHFRLPKLIKELVKLSQSLKYEVPIKAGIIQFLFEKIHPFADGNGRVGRLISTHMMNKGGYGFRGLVSIEETIDNNRNLYYRALEPGVDSTSLVEFFLESFVAQARMVLERLSERREELPEDRLLPRRREILAIIRDHPYCSFDFISRRFPAVNPKTVHYDLKKLQEEWFIVKIGKTRGVTYKAK